LKRTSPSATLRTLRSAGFSPFRCAAIGDINVLAIGGREPMLGFGEEDGGRLNLSCLHYSSLRVFYWHLRKHWGRHEVKLNARLHWV